jgi:hypothetical protein
MKKIYRKNRKVFIVNNINEDHTYNKITIFCTNCNNLLIDIDDEIVCQNCFVRLKRKNGD